MDKEITCDFEWDPVKALSNAGKHDVTFDQAATVFLDALALTVYDEASSQDVEKPGRRAARAFVAALKLAQ